MSERVILHSDLNNFFASVSCLKRPDLQGLPVAVGGSVEERHGIILAKNQEAKKYNVQTAETIWQAKRKCPDLVILPPDYDEYVHYSRLVREIYLRFTDVLQTFSIDECAMDVTGSSLLYGSGYKIAQQIRRTVKKETGLTVSVGVSFTISFAKLASDMKKPDAVTVITRQNYKEKVWPLPAQSLCGVGRKTLKKLQSGGIFTLGDIACSDPVFLKSKLGVAGELLWLCANGEDKRAVCPDENSAQAQSVGRSITFPKDLTDDTQVWQYILFISEKIAAELRKNGLFAGTVHVSVKDTAFNLKEYHFKLDTSTCTAAKIARAAFELFLKHWKWSAHIRALGVRVTSLMPDDVQTSLFEERDDKEERLEKSMEQLRTHFGQDKIVRASLLNLSENVRSNQHLSDAEIKLE